ncbi:MAG TPA: cupin domain-containing protein [Rhodoblastus sp.]|nr:cupin domain-containing protein [Rhodoblastus sp.]
MVRHGSLLSDIPARLADERFETLLARPSVRIERIVSTGQASPPGFWYDQPQDEWVCVIAGAASILIDGEAQPRALKAGDWLEIPAHVRHRVEWTDAARPTVWLALHIDAALQ